MRTSKKLFLDQDKKMKKHFFQFVRFGVVGAMNTVFDLLMYAGLTRSMDFFRAHYLFAAFIAFAISTLNSFIWNKHWTFRDTLKFHHSQLIKFYIGAGVTLVLNQAFLWLFVNLGVYDIFAKVLASLTAGGVNFMMQKFWTFAPKQRILEDRLVPLESDKDRR